MLFNAGSIRITNLNEIGGGHFLSWFSDRRKKTALLHAVMNGMTHVASYLLHQGANPKTADSSGNTLVHYAAAYGWWHCLVLVIEAGADPALPNDWKVFITIADLFGRRRISYYRIVDTWPSYFVLIEFCLTSILRWPSQ